MKQLKTTEAKKYGSFTVTPNISGTTVWFNFNRRGGTARYDLEAGEFKPCRNEVGNRQKSWLEAEYIQ